MQHALAPEKSDVVNDRIIQADEQDLNDTKIFLSGKHKEHTKENYTNTDNSTRFWRSRIEKVVQMKNRNNLIPAQRQDLGIIALKKTS